MRAIGKYWKVILALLLLVAAVVILYLIYFPGRDQYESQVESLEMMNIALEASLAQKQEENRFLESVKDDLDPALDDVYAALDEMTEDREALYDNFPGGLLEEDQLLYVMDLEDTLDMELMFGYTYDSLTSHYDIDRDFTFGTPVALGPPLSDGTYLCCVPIRIDFDMPYAAFKQMVSFLGEDKRITSVHYSQIDYEPYAQHVIGYTTLLYYFLQSDNIPYDEPEMQGIGTGRGNLFELGDSQQ